jgi:hypothetical protein
MKICRLLLLLLAVVALLTPTSASFQGDAQRDLNTLLRDASYVFNRFDEVSVGFGENFPVDIRQRSMEAQRAVQKNVDREKTALNVLLGKSKVSSVELLDVYMELVEVTEQLQNESEQTEHWGDAQSAIEMTRLSAKAGILGANLALALRSQLDDQEQRLALCKKNKATFPK